MPTLKKIVQNPIELNRQEREDGPQLRLLGDRPEVMADWLLSVSISNCYWGNRSKYDTSAICMGFYPLWRPLPGKAFVKGHERSLMSFQLPWPIDGSSPIGVLRTAEVRSATRFLQTQLGRISLEYATIPDLWCKFRLFVLTPVRMKIQNSTQQVSAPRQTAHTHPLPEE